PDARGQAARPLAHLIHEAVDISVPQLGAPGFGRVPSDPPQHVRENGRVGAASRLQGLPLVGGPVKERERPHKGAAAGSFTQHQGPVQVKEQERFHTSGIRSRAVDSLPEPSVPGRGGTPRAGDAGPKPARYLAYSMGRLYTAGLANRPERPGFVLTSMIQRRPSRSTPMSTPTSPARGAMASTAGRMRFTSRRSSTPSGA